MFRHRSMPLRIASFLTSCVSGCVRRSLLPYADHKNGKGSLYNI